MRLEIEIDSEDAAITNNPVVETQRIISQAVQHVAEHGFSEEEFNKVLYDTNGNKAGYIYIYPTYVNIYPTEDE